MTHQNDRTQTDGLQRNKNTALLRDLDNGFDARARIAGSDPRLTTQTTREAVLAGGTR